MGEGAFIVGGELNMANAQSQKQVTIGVILLDEKAQSF